MAISLVEDVKTVSELKKNLRSIFEQLHRTKRPVVVTVNGKPDVVLIEAAAFEKTLETLTLSRLLQEGEESVRAKGTRPAREFLREFKRAKKIPR